MAHDAERLQSHRLLPRQSTLVRRALIALLCARAVARETVTSLDEVPQSQLLAELLDRAFPLSSDAVSWESVDWKRYSKIIVSGPQRSGTTFFALALAQHLGYIHLDENDKSTKIPRWSAPAAAAASTRDRSGDSVTVNARISQMPEILGSSARVVMQRPQWSAELHELPASPDVFVAFLARNCLDVYRSQNRIMSSAGDDTGWTCKYGRTVEWQPYHKKPELHAAIESEHDMICVIKQQAYRNYQRAELDRRGIANAPVGYFSFHSLGSFRNASDRTDLGPKSVLSADGKLVDLTPRRHPGGRAQQGQQQPPTKKPGRRRRR